MTIYFSHWHGVGFNRGNGVRWYHPSKAKADRLYAYCCKNAKRVGLGHITGFDMGA